MSYHCGNLPNAGSAWSRITLEDLVGCSCTALEAQSLRGSFKLTEG